MRALLLLSAVAVSMAYPMPQVPGFGLAPVAAPVAAVPTYTYVPSAQFHSQNEFGGYNYGYVSADGQGKNELRAADGSVLGTYNYIDPSGKPVTVQYSAGPGGFSATGLHLPQQVPLPEANVRAAAEHHAAKAANAAAKAAKAAAAAPAPAPAPAPAAAPAPAIAHPQHTFFTFAG